MDDFDDLEKELKRLTHHKSFKVMDAFRKLDADDKGYVDAADIQRYFGSNDGFSENAPELIQYWSNWHDTQGRLAFEEWHQVLMGHSVPPTFTAPDGYKLWYRTNSLNPTRKYGYIGTFYPEKSQDLLGRYAYTSSVASTVFIGNDHQIYTEQMSWKKQLAKVVKVSSKIALHQIMMASTTEYYHEREYGRSQYGPLHIDDTRQVWQQLDPQERGYTKLDTLLKWLEQFAHW